MTARPSFAEQDPPLEADEFDSMIGRLGPFERRPAVAVAVSGGADSLSLALLARDWTRARGGTATALIVDHGLRAESAREAHTVAGWLEARGITSVILRWAGPKPTTGVQEAARAARYRLLCEWCAAAGVLHLLLGHQRDDQIETVFLRAGRGSGADGLAGMSAIVELAECRIVRPLLSVSGARLRAMLRARGQDWIEDPSNRNPAFARVRARATLRGRPQDMPVEAGPARCAAEAATAALLARSVAIYPEGWATIDPAAWRTAPDLAHRALIRVLLAIGGGIYAPRGERLGPLVGAILEGRLHGGRTLGGCRLVPRGPLVLVAREAGRGACAALPEVARFVWDGRFVLAFAPGRSVGAEVRPLGESGWREVLARDPEMRAKALPYPVQAALPAVFDLEGVCLVPHLLYGRRGADPDSVRLVSAMFRPRHALAGPGFALS